MLAKELAKILLTNPDSCVYIRYDENVVYSEWTSGTEGVIVCLDETAVSVDKSRITLCADLCEKDY